MHPIFRVGLTVLCVIALGWLFLFWGKPALPDKGVVTSKPCRNPFIITGPATISFGNCLYRIGPEADADRQRPNAT